ncbi:hypothetical protein TcasGA2_TC031626 [Tribolium castaneum]|uniref:Uncharacterized protein n=1 Tax=Tribolium castaneum TaxID=7070 RepID=A0A139W9K7_TRICA|nr:hypothetical protein TcasGA2_TC031626 [Tribolium castaneum]
MEFPVKYNVHWKKNWRTIYPYCSGCEDFFADNLLANKYFLDYSTISLRNKRICIEVIGRKTLGYSGIDDIVSNVVIKPADVSNHFSLLLMFARKQLNFLEITTIFEG